MMLDMMSKECLSWDCSWLKDCVCIYSETEDFHANPPSTAVWFEFLYPVRNKKKLCYFVLGVTLCSLAEWQRREKNPNFSKYIGTVSLAHLDTALML